MRTVRWTVTNEEPSEQIKDASWSADRRGKRSVFYIANCGGVRIQRVSRLSNTLSPSARIVKGVA